MDLSLSSPILCAGITMYSPLKHYGPQDDKKITVGIIGVGGLGTMGIKIAKALGHTVMAISTSANKEQMAKDKGANLFCVSKDEESMKKHAKSCDLILNTVSAAHAVGTYLPLLKKNGKICQLGGVKAPHEFSNFQLMMNRWSICGSLIGGIKDTQECVDLCFKHKIYPDCKMIEAKDIQWAWDQLNGANPDGVRYVIDIKKSLENKDFLPKE